MMVGMLSRKDQLIMNRDNTALRHLTIIEKVETEINLEKEATQTITITSITITESLTIRIDLLLEIISMSERIRQS